MIICLFRSCQKENQSPMKTRQIIVLLLLQILLISGCSSLKSEKTGIDEPMIKAGFIYVGPVGDGGWNFTHDKARKKMEKDLGYVKTSYIENIETTTDAERVINRYILEGYDIIFTNSFEFEDVILDIAKKHPEVKFANCGAYKTAPNVGTYFGAMEESRYLTGIIGGMMTKSNRIGYVAAHPVPEVIRGINAFTIAARKVNPKAEVRVVWTHCWYDPGKEREAADALLDLGCDIIAQHQDSPAPQQVAEEHGVFSIGYDSNMKPFAPNSCLTSAVWDWTPYYINTVKALKEGAWKSDRFYGGIKEGIVDITEISEIVPLKVKHLVEENRNMIIAGNLNVFSGPVKSREGKIMIAKGKTPSLKDLFVMDYIVDGVLGKFKK